MIKNIGKALLAAFTSPEAVKLEKALAIFVLARVALALGASYGFVEAIKNLG